MNPSIETLARDFSAILSGWLTPEQRAQVVERNKTERRKSICHSHDFCDANQAMIDALGKHGMELDLESEDQLELVDFAWNMAKSNGFWFGVSTVIGRKAGGL